MYIYMTTLEKGYETVLSFKRWALTFKGSWTTVSHNKRSYYLLINSICITDQTTEDFRLLHTERMLAAVTATFSHTFVKTTCYMETE